MALEEPVLSLRRSCLAAAAGGEDIPWEATEEVVEEEMAATPPIDAVLLA